MDYAAEVYILSGSTRQKKHSPVCTVQDCDGKSFAAGLCRSHYRQINEYGWLEPGPIQSVGVNRKTVDREQDCVIAGCHKVVHVTYLMCDLHYKISWKYRLTSVQLQILWDGGCMMCGSLENLVIDHDHACCPDNKKRKCGECNRGCPTCNWGIGALKDDVTLLQSAIAYLERSNQK